MRQYNCGSIGPSLGKIGDGHKPSWPGGPPTQSPLAFGGGDLVADALGGDLPLELGKGRQHVKRQAAHRGRRVAVLTELYCCGIELLVACMNASISSIVSLPSLLLSIALKIRS